MEILDGVINNIEVWGKWVRIVNNVVFQSAVIPMGTGFS